ncbi:DUF262 domain-containing protein [Streptosporangium sp. NPDC002524]|uniref:DUF262 domain-containing protein n=1 Tax=Streptosporangium sp. NPDC002524 TaxID=3154537 RepID=UPI0033250F93
MADDNEEITVLPEIYLLEQILNMIAAGELRVPKFQRPFVWRPEQMLNLFDSIERGYPIGSLLIWQTKQQLASLDEIGGLKIPPHRPGDQVAYILDGHQRLSTLFGGLKRPSNAPRSAEQQDWMWWIYRVLGDGDDRSTRYRHWKYGDRAPHTYLPMGSILRTMDFLAYARDLSPVKVPGGDITPFIDEAEQVAQRIKQYKMAAVRLVGGSLTHAVEVFSRVNSSGQSMTPDQMVTALTYATTGPDSLADRMEAIQERIAVSGFGEIPSLTIFRAILAISGEEDVQDTRWEALAKRVEGGLLAAVEATDTALEEAVFFLRSHVGVPLARLVPYNLQIMLLAAFFHFCPEPNGKQLHLLERWFWTTSWSGHFAGANTTQVRQSLQEIKDFATGQGTLRFRDQRARPFPQRFDLRSARVRAFILWELKKFPHRVNPDGTALDPEDLMAKSHTEAYRHVVSKRGIAVTSSPANRLMMMTPSRVSLRQALIDMGSEVEAEVLRTHGIPREALYRLRKGDDAAFIDIRLADLAAREREFMAELGVIHAEELLGEADIDTE